MALTFPIIKMGIFVQLTIVDSYWQRTGLAILSKDSFVAGHAVGSLGLLVHDVPLTSELKYQEFASHCRDLARATSSSLYYTNY